MKGKLSGKGHLIVHGITLGEARELLKTAKFEGDWWTQANLNRLDNASAFAMLTHGLEKTKEDEIVKIKVGAGEKVVEKT